MRSARVWKPLVGVAGACSLLLTAAGVAGASESGPKDPPINCATAEHAGFGALWHGFNDCPGGNNQVDGK